MGCLERRRAVLKGREVSATSRPHHKKLKLKAQTSKPSQARKQRSRRECNAVAKMSSVVDGGANRTRCRRTELLTTLVGLRACQNETLQDSRREARGSNRNSLCDSGPTERPLVTTLLTTSPISLKNLVALISEINARRRSIARKLARYWSTLFWVRRLSLTQALSRSRSCWR